MLSSLEKYAHLLTLRSEQVRSLRTVLDTRCYRGSTVALIPWLQQLLQDGPKEPMPDIQCLLFSEEKDEEHNPLGVLVVEAVFIRHRFRAQ